jgi:hypothetical protein
MVLQGISLIKDDSTGPRYTYASQMGQLYTSGEMFQSSC